MKRACLEVEALLGREDDALDGAERTLRTRHLRECADCRAGDGALRGVSELLRRPHPALSEATRERALSAAFAAAEHAPAPAALQPRTTHVVMVLAVAALALFAVLRFGPHAQPPTRVQAPLAARTPAPSAAQPARGTDAPAAPAVAPPESDWIDAQATETRHFAHAEVTLRAGARVRFDAKHSALTLARGEVRVWVDPAPHAPFAVVTQHLRVEVLGTVFTVVPTRVTVQRGRVRVRDARGAVVAAQLRAGESYVHAESAPRTRQGAARPEAPADALLRDARGALGRGEVTAARGLLDRFDAKRASAAAQAEAGTLHAECALLEHDAAAAIRAYVEVATRFPALPAGENAAFASAQLADRQRDARARALYERYLARYPQGRFAPEARAALAHQR